MPRKFLKGVICKRCGKAPAKLNFQCRACDHATRRGYIRHREKNGDDFEKRNFIEGGVGVLLGARGERFIVSVEDFEKCRKHLWFSDGRGYAISKIDGKTTRLHRFVMPGVEVVDHINRNRGDCRRENLRDGGNGINRLNRRMPNAVRYRGVYQASENSWKYTIRVNNKRYYGGGYPSEHAAAVGLWNLVCGMGIEEFYDSPYPNDDSQCQLKISNQNDTRLTA